MSAASVMDGWVVPTARKSEVCVFGLKFGDGGGGGGGGGGMRCIREVMNQAPLPRSRTACAISRTTAKCGRPKNRECRRDQELEWMMRRGTVMAVLRGPLFLPL